MLMQARDLIAFISVKLYLVQLSQVDELLQAPLSPPSDRNCPHCCGPQILARRTPSVLGMPLITSQALLENA